ncbi:TPA: hypothetical protein DDY55_01375 [Candidatus Falkowbacteria bacterium]|nr:hypothetical protein [Candidatus Falkowbacteria bacterium]HAY12551.1 hypothetical protein [Candidatus Falkowbacteria bacterium]HBI96757.1 hypothetical protein [Candidatus Falkowbacteria bacterium]HBT27908.1 hypothetical protein [Candidatus Falkowbacteria bacterium]HBY14711.1 hypothetical protein [Candidatus Falkowbacteria bacterium]
MLLLFSLSACTAYDIPQTYVEPVEKSVIERPIDTSSLTVPEKSSVSERTETDAKTKTVTEKPSIDVPLSNDNHYTNVDGNEVHSPAFAPSRPSGASAMCRDGSYSFSQNRRGTCSRHGGVEEWY